MQVVSDSEVHHLADVLRAELQTFSEVRLFSPDLTPDPETRLMDLVEPVGSTYHPFVLTGTWTEPRKALGGLWWLETNEVTWQPPAGIPWRAWGYYVTSAARLVAMERFAAQLVMDPTQEAFTLKVRIYVAALPVVCSDPQFFGAPAP